MAAALGAALSFWLLHPGQYSFDSAYQLWQARTGNFNNLSPVAMPLLWSALLALGLGPSGLLAFNLLLFWCGLALLGDALRGPVGWRIALILLCGGSPQVLVELAHLLSDAHLAAVLMLACGLAVDARLRGSGQRWLIVALLVYAGTIRWNALLAILPFALLLSAPSTLSRPLRQGLAMLALASATVAFGFLLDRAFVVERKSTWTALAIWDLAAVSVATGDLLLPAFTHGPGLTVAELVETRAFDPVSNVYLFMRSRSGIGAGLITPYTDDSKQALRQRWWAVMQAYPAAYLAHRFRTFLLLIGCASDGTRGIPFLRDRMAYRDNPPLPPAVAETAQDRLYATADGLVARGAVTAIPALLMAAVALLFGWRHRRQRVAVAGAITAASALLYAAGFLLLAPGAELRYLTWPIVVAPLALALAVCGRDATPP